MKTVLDKLKIEEKSVATSTGQNWFGHKGETISSISPVDNEVIASTHLSTLDDYETGVKTAQNAYKEWRKVPAPERGEIIRQIGEALREQKQELGKLVSYEMGKSYQEGLGEVQEMIDIADFAVGLSRQLYGLTMHSERPEHRMYEQWHPLGVVGIISAFNFPVAVWSWNAFIAWICGNVCVWKPSEKTPITAIACQKIAADVFARNNVPEGVSVLVNGGANIGVKLSEDPRVALVSATGSTRMGKEVAKKVAARLGKSLLELGGNNAMIISPKANLETAILGAVFGAVGTAGQRCTSTRRLIVHESLFETVTQRIASAYTQLKIGNPLDESNHIGPLIDEQAVAQYSEALEKAKAEGAKVIVEGGQLPSSEYGSPCYVKPAVFEVKNNFEIVQQETFAPILYVIKYSTLEEAIEIQNDVPQGLSSAIMTNDLLEAEEFLSCNGSDCGIANVNIGTSGAEIGGAFGGEKETGGGRESGSDAWKAYMRRQTNTINYGKTLPLAQGIKFTI